MHFATSCVLGCIRSHLFFQPRILPGNQKTTKGIRTAVAVNIFTGFEPTKHATPKPRCPCWDWTLVGDFVECFCAPWTKWREGSKEESTSKRWPWFQPYHGHKSQMSLCPSGDLFWSSMRHLPCKVCRLRVERPHPSETQLIYTNLIFPMSTSVIKVLKDIWISLGNAKGFEQL